MITNLPRRSSRIARRAVNQGARPVNAPQVTVEKCATEDVDPATQNVPNDSLIKCKKSVWLSTFNTRTLRDTQIYELVASAEQLKQEIIFIQEHRYLHEESPIKEHDLGKQWKLITSSAWKNSVNASTGGIGLLLSPLAYKSLKSIESITKRILIATFHGNPQTTIINCYSPTNVEDETVVENFYSELSSVARQVPKHNLLLIGGDFNAHLGQEDGYHFAYHHTTNRNGTMLNNFIKEQNLLALNTSFQKRIG
ncbi:craniofacial development protein 2-like [Clytia hemisphaerica]|uniref:craniofacial development protein 2-like n=1 Tax=Clytia hemisphaerica TaxID=252671 RepID=UPI0034D4648F